MGKGVFYTDFIEESELYGVFHTETNICYATFCSEGEANEYMEEI